MDRQLLSLLVCPLCKGTLTHDKTAQTLSCAHDKLAFPIVDGIPTMLVSEARPCGDNNSPTKDQANP